MGKFILIALGFVALVAFFAGRDGVDRSAFGKCVEKRGIAVADSTEFATLASQTGLHGSLGEELDDHSLSLRTPVSEGLAFVAESDNDATDVNRAFVDFTSGYTMQLSGNVVVAWSSGPDDTAAAAVRSCTQ